MTTKTGKGKTGLLLGVALAAAVAGADVPPPPFADDELTAANFDAACDRRTAAWEAHIRAYKPDYSDSSDALQPPVSNRLAQPFAVVRDGKPACEVVLSSELAEPCLATAAKEFVRYVKAITGVELPIVVRGYWDIGRRNGLNKLCLGKRCLPRVKGDFTYAEPKYAAALARLSGRDGYAIMTEAGHPERLYVFGACDKGAMNGVYALLENNTDIIWARPDESVGTVYTERKGELALVWGADVVSVPATRGRGWNGYRDVPWMARNGCNIFNAGGGGDIAGMNRLKTDYGVLYTRHMGGHNIGIFLRGMDRWHHVREGNPCFTSREVLAVVTSNVLQCARLAPDATDKIYFNIHDTWKGCECARCKEPIRCADGTVLGPEDERFRSTQYWLFMNEVGRALAREFPRMSLVSLAYFPTAAAPKCRLEPNVHPEFAPYVRVNDKTPITARENRSWLRRLVDWSKVAAEVEVYEYYGLGLKFPRPLAEVRAWDFTVMNPFVLGMTTEYCHNGDDPKQASARAQWDASAIEFWTMCKLYWDPSQDVEQLRKRFIRRAFREAAPEIERVYGTIRAAFFADGKASTLGDAPLELAKSLLVDAKRDREIETLLDAARARKTLHPKSRLLVEALRTRLMAQVEEARNLKNPMLTVPLLRPEGEVGFDSAIWAKGAEIASFCRTGRQREQAADVPTEARVFHDSDGLWLRVRCGDPKIADLPEYKGRPGVAEEVPEVDHLEVFVGDAKDSATYYLFAIVPGGVYADLKGYDESWNGPWRRETRRTADGWEALVRIPLATVGGDETTRALKVLLWRDYEPHGGRGRSYSSWGGGSPHQSATFGDMTLMR